MGSESFSSNSNHEYYHHDLQEGHDMELLSFPNAQLYLVDEQESMEMQRGNFKLVLTKQHNSPLAALVALVKDVEFPVGKDCPTLKLGHGCYAFCLPHNIIYGLVLSSDVQDSSIRQLDHFLMQYCTFEDHSYDIGAWYMDESGATDYWNEVAPRVTSVCAKMGYSTENSGSRKSPVRQMQHTKLDHMSPRMMKRVQQARRLSAISKLFSRALMKGAICKMKHIENVDRRNMREECVASVDAFAKVVDAVESAGRSIADFVGRDGQQRDSSKNSSAWTLNRLGLHMLVGAVAASTAINLARKSAKSGLNQVGVKQLPQRPPLCPTACQPKTSSSHGFRPVQPPN